MLREECICLWSWGEVIVMDVEVREVVFWKEVEDLIRE